MNMNIKIMIHLVCITGFLLVWAEPLQAQVQVQGTVTDAESGETLPGVNVIIKGTTQGTATDADGSFELSMPSLQDTLVFSFVGYQTREVPVNGQTEINVALTLQAIAGEELVVVGYGTQRSEELSGSVASVSASEIQDLPVTGVDQMLSAQMAGVQVSRVTGTPGGGTVIRIRGAGSIGAGDDPLFVIDGFPVSNDYNQTINPLASINPNDIESITVLKDASATAIYGSRGSNGVILIETKQARAGITEVALSTYTGWQRIPNKGRPDMLTAEEFAQWRVEHRIDEARFNGDPPPSPEDIPEEYRDPASLGEGTNWFNELTRTAPTHNVNLSISTGSENVRAYISGDFLNQDGVVIGTRFKRYSLRGNIDAQVSDKVSIGVNLAPVFTDRNIRDTEGHFNSGVLTQGILSDPLTPVRQSDGSLTPSVGSFDTFANANPVNQALNTDRTFETARLLMNAYADYEIIDGLSLRSMVGIDWRNSQQSFFLPSTVGNFRAPPPQPSSAFFNEETMRNWLIENTLNFDKTIINENHRLSGVVGFTAQKEHVQYASINGTDFANDRVRTLNAASLITNGSTSISEWSLLSYLGRINYIFDNKYLFTATVRIDGSSKFGNNNKWGTFPSASVGWRISEEEFISNLSFISNLKIRASYGLSGNNSIGNYTYIAGLATQNYVFGGSLAAGRALSDLANQDLGWEESRQLDIGLDLGVFNDRITLTADYYSRYTEEMLLNIPVPSASGFTSAITNLGKIHNYGVEFALSSQNIHGEFTWTTDFNISANRNKVLALNEDDEPIRSATHITEVGKPMGQFYGYIFDGIFQSQQEVENEPSDPGAAPGTIKFKDVNGDGVITSGDRTAMGNPHPNFIFGMSNRFTYKNFDLSILLKGAQGNKILAWHRRFTTNLDGVFNVTSAIKGRWRSPEQPGNGLIPTDVTNSPMARQGDSRWVEDASYIKVENITLGYNVPITSIGRIGFIKSARIYASVQNALLFTKYPGGNPEINTSGNSSLGPNVDYTGYPVPRTIVIGANITF